jgi:uncharacterized membrane protein
MVTHERGPSSEVGATGTGREAVQSGGERGLPGSRPGRAATDRLARGLGWLSIGVGLAEVTAPRGVARMVGVPGHRALFRLLGVRELVSGVGILSRPQPAGWLWSRVGGDVMDLALLGAALRSAGTARGRAAAATAAVAGVTAVDVVTSRRVSRRAGSGRPRTRMSITLNRPPEDVYRFWRDFQNLPRFMRHLGSVRETGPGRSRWTATGPAGLTLEWDAETLEDRPGELIAWRSLEGSAVQHHGAVWFRPAPGRATELTLEIDYRPPGGAVGAALARLLGADPGQRMREDLRRLKQLVETGEVPTTEGQPSGPAPGRSPVGSGERRP